MPFDVPNPDRPRPWGLLASAALHFACLACILWISRPVYLTPTSVIAGAGGVSITRIYWPGAPTTEGGNFAGKSSGKPSRSAAKPLLPVQKSSEASTTAQIARAETQPENLTSSERARSAGSPMGSLWADMMAGHVIRPALPSRAYDPIVTLDELNGREGDVIVEVTIDATGKVVSKAVLKGMGSEIDTRVLAALEGWEFLPATRDGVAIASKQDVYYHFPQRR